MTNKFYDKYVYKNKHGNTQRNQGENGNYLNESI